MHLLPKDYLGNLYSLQDPALSGHMSIVNTACHSWGARADAGLCISLMQFRIRKAETNPYSGRLSVVQMMGVLQDMIVCRRHSSEDSRVRVSFALLDEGKAELCFYILMEILYLICKSHPEIQPRLNSTIHPDDRARGQHRHVRPIILTSRHVNKVSSPGVYQARGH